MRKQIWLLAVSFGAMSASLFLAGCGGAGKKITLNPADPPPPPPVPVVNVPSDLKGTIVFSGPSGLSSGKGNAIYALSASKGLEKVADGAGGMCFSPDGRYLVYQKATGETIPISSTGTRAVVNTVILDRNWAEVRTFRDRSGDYSWSPSGRYLMFGDYWGGGIYVVDTGSWEIVNLIPSGDADELLSPRMSPDETVLVWTGFKEGQDLAIYRSLLGGRLTITILEVAFATNSRSRQNTVNLFLDNHQMIYTVDDKVLLGEINSSQSWQIANLPSLRAVKLSPNKEKLACLTVDGLYVYSTASWQEQMVVSNPDRANKGLAWSPDNGSLVVTEDNYQTTKSIEVILYDLQGGKKKIASLPSNESRGYTVDWAP